MPMMAPQTAVACSHSNSCAPRGASTLTPHPDLVRTSSKSQPGPKLASTSSGVLGEKLGAVGDSTITGSTPLPSLPVDSAISCSAQSPKPA